MLETEDFGDIAWHICPWCPWNRIYALDALETGACKVIQGHPEKKKKDF